MKYLLLPFIGFMMIGLRASAGSKDALTVQGTVLYNGTALTSSAASFNFQIYSPGGCLLWSQNQTLDLSSTDGTFTATVGGTGNGSTNLASGGLTWQQVFQNGVALGSGSLTGTNCPGGTYTGTAFDDRTLYLTFNDGSGGGNQSIGPIAINGNSQNSLLAGIPVIGSPTDGQFLQYSSAAGAWQPYSYTLPSSYPSSAGTWGDYSTLSIPQITVNAQGLITAISAGTIAAYQTNGSITGTSALTFKSAASSALTLNSNGGNIVATGNWLQSSGNVGINTSSVPTVPLFVNGSATISGSPVGGIDGEFWYDTSTHTFKYNSCSPGCTTNTLGTASITTTGTAWSVSGSSLYYSAGNVGIGTSNPTSTLHVAGNANITGAVTATTFNGSLTGHASSDLALTGGTLSGALTINQGSTTSVLTVTQSSTGGGVSLTNLGSGTGLYVSSTTGYDAIFTGGGFVGIGTTTPTDMLTVDSGHLASHNSGTALSVSACGTGTTIAGSDNSFKVTVGTGTVTTCAINFGTTWGTAPNSCVFTPGNTTMANLMITGQPYVSSITTTVFTLRISSGTLANSIFYVHCF